ncbi:MAG: MFS transporter, partial [Clostridiales bacterium]|nr:MFS transporter [Clostridiales bacterium]
MAILLLAVIYVAFISLGLPDSLFGVAWPLMHIELNLDEGFAAVYMLIVGVCTASVSFLAGPIIRKLGTEWVTAVSVTLTAVGMIGIGLSPNIWVMMVFAFLMGIGAGAIDTALNDFVSKHYKARHMSWLHGFWGIGVTLSPLIMSIFLDMGGWRGGYMTMSYIQFGLAAIMFTSFPLWKRVRAIHDKQDKAIKDKELEKNEKTIEETETTPGGKKEKYNIFKEKGVLFAGIALALYCGMEYIVGLWGASYLVNTRLLSPAVAARYVSLYYGGIMAGRFLTGALTLKLSNKILIRGGTVICLLGVVLLAIPLDVLALPGMLLIGIGFGPIFPTS